MVLGYASLFLPGYQYPRNPGPPPPGRGKDGNQGQRRLQYKRRDETPLPGFEHPIGCSSLIFWALYGPITG